MKRIASYRNSGAKKLVPPFRPDMSRNKAVIRCIRTGLAAATVLLTTACTSSHRTIAADVPFAAWDRTVEMAFDNDDTTSLCDLTLFLRCNDRFVEDTLTVRIEIRTPDSLRCEEPFILAIPHANSPAALVREAVIPYRRRVCFERPGQYRVRITPSRSVRGVEAVGVDIAEL